MIAHVGHTKTGNDSHRISKVFDYLKNKGELDVFETKGDFIDLNKGRDFLAEDNKYDAVVLHFLFRGGFCIDKIASKKQLKISPLNSWPKWRQRLIETGAKYVFAFGGIAEIGGSYICNLDGYKSEKVEEEFWVFEKI